MPSKLSLGLLVAVAVSFLVASQADAQVFRNRNTVISNGKNTTIVQNRGLFGQRTDITQVSPFRTTIVDNRGVFGQRNNITSIATGRGFVNANAIRVNANPYFIHSRSFAAPSVFYAPSSVFSVRQAAFAPIGQPVLVAPVFGCH